MSAAPDRRLTPATDRIALESMRGVIDRPAYTPGRPMRLAVPLADLLRAPGGARDRQVNFGADLTLIDEQDGWSFVQAALDGYCGWLKSGDLLYYVSYAILLQSRIEADSMRVDTRLKERAEQLPDLGMEAELRVGVDEPRPAA